MTHREHRLPSKTRGTCEYCGANLLPLGRAMLNVALGLPPGRHYCHAKAAAAMKASAARFQESIDAAKAALADPDPNVGVRHLFGVSQSTLLQINNGEFDVEEADDAAE